MIEQQDSATDWLDQEAASAQCVVFASGITDLRDIERRLQEQQIDYRCIRMGMGSTAMRDRFHVLSDGTRWRTLPQIYWQGRFIGGEPELMAQLQASHAQIPRPALLLGLAGLLPFFAGVFALWLGIGPSTTTTVTIAIAYAASILAFMAGVQWGGVVAGDATRMWARLLLSVTPALLAWLVLLIPAGKALMLALSGFGMVLAVDIWWQRHGWWPAWYLRLRWLLTGVVFACLLGLLLFGLLLPGH